MKLISLVEDDQVLAAIRHAPVVESTPEEMAAFEEGLADIRAARTASAEQVRVRRQAHQRE